MAACFTSSALFGIHTLVFTRLYLGVENKFTLFDKISVLFLLLEAPLAVFALIYTPPPKDSLCQNISALRPSAISLIAILLLVTLIQLIICFVLAVLWFMGRPMYIKTAFEEAQDSGLSFKNSEDYPFHVDLISREDLPISLSSGSLGMSMSPGRWKGAWRRNLSKDIDELKTSHAVDVLVTLLTENEMQAMRMGNLERDLERNHMEGIHYAIRDKWVPDDVRELASVIEKISVHLKMGKSVVVHCNGGKGRTGLIVASVLMAAGGYSFKEAVSTVWASRKGTLRNPLQLAYLFRLQRLWSKWDQIVLEQV
eukprot:TRINITY_DN12335_c0_g1_i1.p1 TRINITY_DN12335_c0_g1~~TRINITY_DN12335_c0_g1_i1.p1  ORF type:complete len:333 (+),score=87.25 TRINITY_DN12335_c0_g1_i1:67-999(+)